MTAEARTTTVESSHGRVAKNAIIYFIGQLLSWSVTFLTVSIIPRTLGEQAMGELAIATTMATTIAGALKLSMDSWLTAEVGRNRQDAERLISLLFGLRICLLPFLVAVSLAALVWTPDLTAMTWRLTWLYVVIAALNFFSDPLRSMMQGMEQAKQVSARDFLLALPPLFALPFLRYGPVVLVMSSLIVTAITLAMALHWARAYIRLSVRFEPSQWGYLARGGLPFFANSFIVQFYNVGSVFILRSYSGDAAVGVYSQAMRLQGTFLFIATAIGWALLPSLARLADASAEDFRRIQQRVLTLMITLSLPVTTLIFVLAEPFSHLLYGKHKFVDMPLALQVAAFKLIPLYITTVMYQFLVAKRRNAVWSIFLASTVGLNALFCYALIPLTTRLYHNPPMGAVLAGLIAEALTAVCAFVVLKTNPLNADTLKRIGRTLVATAGMAAVLWLTRSLFLLIPATLGVLTFALLAWYLGALGDEERDKLASLVRRKLGRNN